MARISYVNGKYIDHKNALIHIEDRGYQFSDGVYEVYLVKSGNILDFDEHIDRLENSLKGLKIKANYSAPMYKEIMFNLLEKNKLKDAIIYLQITRGVAVRDHAFPTNIDSSLVITICKYTPPDKKYLEEGVKVISTDDIRWKRRDLKTISLLPNILAKQEAVEKDAMEAIFIESDGTITEGSSTNFFIINQKDEIITHPANNLILNGITRQNIIKIAKANNFKVKEEVFTLKDVYKAKAAFISSTTKIILPVINVNDKIINNGILDEYIKKLINLCT